MRIEIETAEQCMTVTMYGIKNCDTIKKARAWLDSRGIPFHFHDYKASGVTEQQLRQWCAALGWEKLLNRAGTTFKKLPEADREAIDMDKAIALMQAQPSMIKRPVLDTGKGLVLGFKPEVYEQEVLAK